MSEIPALKRISRLDVNDRIAIEISVNRKNLPTCVMTKL